MTHIPTKPQSNATRSLQMNRINFRLWFTLKVFTFIKAINCGTVRHDTVQFDKIHVFYQDFVTKIHWRSIRPTEISEPSHQIMEMDMHHRAWRPTRGYEMVALGSNLRYKKVRLLWTLNKNESLFYFNQFRNRSISKMHVIKGWRNQLMHRRIFKKLVGFEEKHIICYSISND